MWGDWERRQRTFTANDAVITKEHVVVVGSFFRVRNQPGLGCYSPLLSCSVRCVITDCSTPMPI